MHSFHAVFLTKFHSSKNTLEGTREGPLGRHPSELGEARSHKNTNEGTSNAHSGKNKTEGNREGHLGRPPGEAGEFRPDGHSDRVLGTQQGVAGAPRAAPVAAGSPLSPAFALPTPCSSHHTQNTQCERSMQCEAGNAKQPCHAKQSCNAEQSCNGKQSKRNAEQTMQCEAIMPCETLCNAKQSGRNTKQLCNAKQWETQHIPQLHRRLGILSHILANPGLLQKAHRLTHAHPSQGVQSK